MQESSKRPSLVALTALIVSVVFFLGMLILSTLNRSFAVFSLSWQILATVLIWVVLAIQFHQRKLAEQEKLDIAQLAAAQTGDTIFQAQQAGVELFAVAQQRLKIFEKWFLPIFAVLIGLYQVSVGIFLFSKAAKIEAEPGYLLLSAVLAAAIAFLSFLFSLYAIGMSSQAEWKPLRAGGTSLLATTIITFLLTIALAAAQFGFPVGLSILNWAIPVLLVVLGAETLLNFVLDIYRPRIEGAYSVAAFDSRLLAIIASPATILQTTASAIDYQFGFKVSQTWFFLILRKAVAPLVLLSILILYLMSCFVIIDSDCEAIVERFGSSINADGKVRLVGPGLGIKLPWPFDIAYTFPTKHIQQINVGFVPEEDEDKLRKPLLWGKEHYEKEFDILVATETLGTYEEGIVPVSIIKVSIPIQFRVKDLHAYRYNHRDTKKALEAISYREVINYAASAEIDAENSLFGAGRLQAAKILTERIQARADNLNMGVEIVFLGLQGIHPPAKVAPDYQAVIGAIQKKQASILNVMAERNKALTSLAGSTKQADLLYDLAQKLQESKAGKDAKAIATAKAEFVNAIDNASGEIFKSLREAKSYAYQISKTAEATGKRFESQVKAYQAAENIYRQELRLSMLEDALGGIRKYIVAADANDHQVFIIDLNEKLMPDLYDIDTTEK